MRKIIIITLLFALVFTGCQKKSENDKKPELSGNSEGLEAALDLNDQPVIISEDEEHAFETINIYMTSNSDHMMTAQEEKDWENYINKKYGIDINFIYYNPNEIGKNELFTETDCDGIAYASNMFINDLIAKRYVKPINEYENQLTNINTMYDRATVILKGNRDLTYAVPSYIQETFSKMYYYESMLDLVDMEAPESLEAYEALGEKLKQHDIYLMIHEASAISFLTAFTQVFTAYGCYINREYPYGIVYNPISLKYELPILTDNFLQAFSYLNDLQDKGFIFSWKDDSEVSDKKAITYDMYPRGFVKDQFGGMNVSYYMTGSNKEKLIYTSNNCSGFMVLKNTQEVSRYMSFLIDTLYKDYEMMFDFHHGIEGHNYTIENGVRYIHNIKDNWAVINYPGLWISLVNGVFNERSSYIDYEEIEKNRTGNAYDKYQEVKALDREEMFYYVDLYRDDTINRQYNIKLLNIADEFYDSVMIKKISFGDALFTYKEQIANLGILELLDQLNESIND